MNVAERITLLRTDKGYSVNKLANIAGLSQGFVRQIELGEKKPTIESLNLICDALDITLSDFFKEEPLLTREELLKSLSKDINDFSPAQLEILIKVANVIK